MVTIRSWVRQETEVDRETIENPNKNNRAEVAITFHPTLPFSFVVSRDDLFFYPNMQAFQPRPAPGCGAAVTAAASLGGADDVGASQGLHLAVASTMKASVHRGSSATNAKEDDVGEDEEEEEDDTPPPQPPKKPSSRFIPSGDRCQRCILQRKGCDGVKPVCGNCSRRTRGTGGPCVYPQGRPSRRELAKMNDQQGNAGGASQPANNTRRNGGSNLTSVAPPQVLHSGHQATNIPSSTHTMQDGQQNGQQTGTLPLNTFDAAAAAAFGFDPSPQFDPQIGNMASDAHNLPDPFLGQQLDSMAFDPHNLQTPYLDQQIGNMAFDAHNLQEPYLDTQIGNNHQEAYLGQQTDNMPFHTHDLEDTYLDTQIGNMPFHAHNLEETYLGQQTDNMPFTAHDLEDPYSGTQIGNMPLNTHNLRSPFRDTRIRNMPFNTHNLRSPFRDTRLENMPFNTHNLENPYLGQQTDDMPFTTRNFEDPYLDTQIGDIPFDTHNHQEPYLGQQIGDMPQNNYLIAAAAAPHTAPQSGSPQEPFPLLPPFHPQPRRDVYPPRRLQAPGLRQQSQSIYNQPPPVWNPRPNAEPGRRSRSPEPIYTTMSPASVRAGQFPVKSRPAVHGGDPVKEARERQALRLRTEWDMGVEAVADAPVIPTGGVSSNREPLPLLAPTRLPTLNWGPHYIGTAALNPFPPHGVCSGPHGLTRQLPEAVRPEEPLGGFEEDAQEGEGGGDEGEEEE